MTRYLAIVARQVRPGLVASLGMTRRKNTHFTKGRACATLMAAVLHATTLRPAHAGEVPHEQASPLSQRPDDLFRTGLAEYDAGRYRQAIELFARAYEQTHASALLFNMAQAWRLLGDCSKSADMYEAFVLDDPTSPDVARAKGWLDKLRPCQQRAPVFTAPKNTDLPSARSSSLAVTRPSLSLSPAAPSANPPPPGHPWLVGVLSGACFALAGAGAYSAWHARDLATQTTTSFQNGGTWDGEATSVEHEGKRAQIDAIALLSAALVSGVAAYVVHRASMAADSRTDN